MAVQVLPQERKSLQTRTLWLPVEHGEMAGLRDGAGGIGLPDEF